MQLNARALLWRIHSWLGITLGIVLAVMALSGAMIAFQDEIMEGWSGGVITTKANQAPRLSPDSLIARAERQTGLPVLILSFPDDKGCNPFVRFAKGRRDPSFGARSYIDSVSGQLLGDLKGQAFFDTLLDVHRFLALSGPARPIGRLITGMAALCLLFFAFSGLYLRWPRRPLRWKSWFDIDFRRKGRAALRMIHVAVGPWFLILYLYSALTGLWWAFDWYQQGVTYLLTGASPAASTTTMAHRPLPPARPIDPAWRSFRTMGLDRDHGRVIILVPRDDQPILFLAGVRGALDANAVDRYRFDSGSGAFVDMNRYADRPMLENILPNMRQVHQGRPFGLLGRMAIFLSALTLPLLAVTGLLMYRARRPKKPTRRHKAN